MNDLEAIWQQRLLLIALFVATLMVAMVFFTYIVSAYTSFKYPEKFRLLAGDNASMLIALPQCAAVSFALVVFLRQTDGPITIEGLGFKFTGAAGPVILWILCYLAMAYSCKIVSKGKNT